MSQEATDQEQARAYVVPVSTTQGMAGVVVLATPSQWREIVARGDQVIHPGAAHCVQTVMERMAVVSAVHERDHHVASGGSIQ